MDILNLLDVQKKKHIWVKKSTGLGITELFLRYIAYICTRDNRLRGKRICILTGPRIDLAITLMDRLKAIITEKSGIVFNTKETLMILNNCIIEAYPSHHIDSMRGLTDVKFILLDEADFFSNNPSEQENVRTIAERYIIDYS
jgi:late competence protein required for DNA uptake (superfamily II DNA/RNA helicase)